MKNRYCEGCKHLTKKTGYCNKVGTKMAAEAFLEELQDLDRYDYYSNSQALLMALENKDYMPFKNPYSELCSVVYKKLKGLQLEKERQLIAESRALLTAYDDFMFGLKSNQYLYNQQEQMYNQRVAQLQANYDNAVKYVLMTAQKQGVALDLPEVKFIGAKSNG